MTVLRFKYTQQLRLLHEYSIFIIAEFLAVFYVSLCISIHHLFTVMEDIMENNDDIAFYYNEFFPHTRTNWYLIR